MAAPNTTGNDFCNTPSLLKIYAVAVGLSTRINGLSLFNLAWLINIILPSSVNC